MADFVEICKFCARKAIIEAVKRIINSDKVCHSYCDLNFGVTFLEHNVFKVLKFTSAGRINHINHTYTEEIAANSGAVWFVKFVFVSPSMGNRTESKKFIDININKPKYYLITPYMISEEATQFKALKV